MEGYKMSLHTRRKELKKLISDGEELGFSEPLLNEYRKQEAGIIETLKSIKEERERFKKNLEESEE